MKDILTVFSFTLRDGVRKKAFQITTILVLALIVIACAIPRFMDMAGKHRACREIPRLLLHR